MNAKALLVQAKVRAIGINRQNAPGPGLGLQNFRGIEMDGLLMIPVHVLNR